MFNLPIKSVGCLTSQYPLHRLSEYDQQKPQKNWPLLAITVMGGLTVNCRSCISYLNNFVTRVKIDCTVKMDQVTDFI